MNYTEQNVMTIIVKKIMQFSHEDIKKNMAKPNKSYVKWL